MADTTVVSKTLAQWAEDGMKSRLAVLREETREIEQALAAVKGKSQTKVKAKAASKTKAKAKSSNAKAKAKSSNGRRGRKPGRAPQFISLVEKNPGVTISEAAKQMKIKPNYLYRVSADLLSDGRITKDGHGYKVV